MFERTRALFKLKSGERCPGEDVCTSNALGECKKRGKTLVEICKPEIDGDSPRGCKFYYTKQNTTPIQFRGFVQAFYLLRGREKRGQDLRENDFPYWAIQAYEIGSNVFSQVEAEEMDTDESDNPNNSLKIGKGDSGAFELINEQVQEHSKMKRKW